MNAADVDLLSLRPLAFGIAYRMLGTVSDAEDVVQEALLRVHRTVEAGEDIASPRAFVATVTTRLAINELSSARVRRTSYVGDWLPEPILTDPADGTGDPGDPVRHAELADSLSLALLVVLETLSPEQRAVLLLHDVFGYSHAEIAPIIESSEANVRQLAVRARRHVAAGTPRFRTSRGRRDELTRRFLAAAERGDLPELEAMLAHDVTLTGDGGGKAPALARSLEGRSRVAHAVSTWIRLGARTADIRRRLVEVNGGPGVVYLDDDGRVVAVLALDVDEHRIRAVNAVANPDKLRHLQPTGTTTPRSAEQGGALTDRGPERS